MTFDESADNLKRGEMEGRGGGRGATVNQTQRTHLKGKEEEIKSIFPDACGGQDYCVTDKLPEAGRPLRSPEFIVSLSILEWAHLSSDRKEALNNERI